MNKFYILLFLATFWKFGFFYDYCSTNTICITGKCCGPYADWNWDYTCCPTQSFCGSTVCVSYWVVIVPCVCVGIAIFGGILIIIMQRKRRARRQQLALVQQQNQPQINQPQVYYVPQTQPQGVPYQPGQPVSPVYNQDQPQYGYNQQAYQ